MIAIIAAMDKEVWEIEKYATISSKKIVAGTELTYGSIGNKDIVICKSGVGKCMASMSTTIVCLEAKPDVIINIGTAGGLIEEEDVMDIVISDKVIQADYDSSPIDGPDGLGLFFESDEHVQNACIEAAKSCGIRYHVGSVATQDLFMARDEDFQRVMKLFPDSICSEMEAGAVAQVATTFNIPFVIVRSLSDTIYHHENAMEFTKYVSLAADQSARLVKSWIENL